MRGLNINKRPIYYALYEKNKPIVDADGFYTGETESYYTEPIMIMANVSAAQGESSIQPFGGVIDYNRVICLSEKTCPFAEDSRLWFGTTPQDNPSHNYEVKKIADSINGVLIAIKEVKVS